jgi:hypothetical protein
MLELSTANPQILQVAGDLIMRNMDFPQAEEIAKRLELLLPPAVRGEQPPPTPEQQLVMGQVKVEEIKAQALLAKSQADLQGKGGDMQMKQGEMQLQQQEMGLKQQEMALRERESTMRAQVDMEKLQLDREKIALEREKIVAGLVQGAQAQQQMPMMGEMPEQEDGVEAQAIVASVQELAATFAQVAQAMLAPKRTRLEHGPDGRPVGSVTESLQ